MTQALARREASLQEISVFDAYSHEQIDIIKNSIAKGATDTELAYFLSVAKKRGLDVLSKQIHFIKRKQKINGQFQEVGTIQTGIDGLRLIADRTGRYAPGRRAELEYDDKGKLVSATAFVMKMVGAQWFEVSGTAYWDEYVQSYDGKPMGLWAKMPRGQLVKCAEALALRKAFPESLEGLYVNEEMQQADAIDVTDSSTVKTAELAPPDCIKILRHSYSWADVETQTLRDALAWLKSSKADDELKKQVVAELRERANAEKQAAAQTPPPAAPPAEEVHDGEVVDEPHPADALADVAETFDDAPDAEPSPLAQTARKTRVKASGNLIKFTERCKELGLDFDNRAARLAAANQWAAERDYEWAPVNSFRDIPSGVLYLMTEDLGVALTW